jgi:hypothetical protein
MIGNTSFTEVRLRIDNVEDEQIQMFLRAVYLLGAAPDEMTGKLVSQSSHIDIYGPKGSDVIETTFNPEQPSFNFNHVMSFLEKLREKEFNATEFVNLKNIASIPISLFTLRTAKQGKKGQIDKSQVVTRTVALPLIEKYEPWARPLLNILKARAMSLFFHLIEQRLAIILFVIPFSQD